MNKRFSILFLLAILLSSCGKPAAPPPTRTPLPPTPTSTPTHIPTARPTETVLVTVTPVCISPEPTQADINRALTYTGQALTASEWERSYGVAESHVAVTWQNVGHGGLVYIEARIKPCGYEEPDLNKDFNDENWKALFANYESYQPVTECRTDTGLRLYQFKTQNQGFEYMVNYWVQSDTDTRVITTMIVFPLEEQALLWTYSAQIFPTLPNCS
jgi:hypothetical protein